MKCRRCGWPILPDQKYDTTYAGSVSGATMYANHVHKNCHESFPVGASGVRQEETAAPPPGERS